MKTHHLSTIAVAVAVAAATCSAADAGSTADHSRPNVLFIAIDDLRPALGCYGDTQVTSPNIDRLASQSLLFKRAYCQVPVCGASRASLMTGILPTSERFIDYTTWAEKDAPNAVTLPQVFKEAGYITLSNGKIFHHPEDTAGRSWSEPAWEPADAKNRTHLDPTTTRKRSARQLGRIYESPDVPDNAYADGRIAEKTIRDLQRLKKGGDPFFLACGFHRPHLPFYAPKKYWDLYDRDDIQLADNRQRPAGAPAALRGSGEYRTYHLGDFKDNSDGFHRMMRHGYYASVSYSDKLTGDVLNELDRLGLADNTIVVIWGDHGWQLGEHNFWGKHNTLHNSLRVPLIVKAPGKCSNQETDSLVEVIDIFPTLCALANLPVPATVQGRSFVSLLDDPTQSFRTVSYSRFKHGDAVVTDRFTYTSYGDQGEMLYDLANDSEENFNLADNAEFNEDAAGMRQLLQQELQLAAQARFDAVPAASVDSER